MPTVTKSPVALCFRVVSPSVHPDVPRTSMQFFSVFSATAYPIDTRFSPLMRRRMQNFINDDYDIIGNVGWQPCWKNGKTLDLCIY